MTRMLYIDAIAGVAGDMLLAALIDAGAAPDAVVEGLAGLPVEDVRVEWSRVERHGIVATRLEVVVPPEPAHRTWADVRELIGAAELPARARHRAQETFRRLAVAEGRIHGVAPETVHFHEVGALDAIVDVCGVALALELLDVTRVCCSSLPAGRGFVRAAHGVLPLPAPATLELLKGAPMHGVALTRELVTPTGAALVAALTEEYGALPAMEIEDVGYGAGARDLAEIPNVCRVILGRPQETVQHGHQHGPGVSTMSVVETNLDDLSPELVPDAVARCFAAGAVDVWTTPTQMKKGRPGLILAALTAPDLERPVAEAMFRETSTLGVRLRHVARWELDRSSDVVDVDGHPIRVKVGRLEGAPVNAAPEHDDCAAVAARTGRPVKAVWAAAIAAAHQKGLYAG